MMRSTQPIYIRGGQLLDPENESAQPANIYLSDGKISPIPDRPPAGAIIIDASGLHIAPGFLDIHVHLREPGGEHAETVASGAESAARGGFTGIVAMPNTTPPIDTADRVSFVLEQGRKAGFAEVMTTACLTRHREGKELAPLEELAEAGTVAFTDDGCTVQADDVMEQAMKLAASLNIPVMDHAQDRTMELQGGAMHEGARSQALGIPGIPAEAETRIVARDIILAEKTGCALHIQHVSCAESVQLIREAQQRGVRVTAEATPHHLMFCDDDVNPDEPDRFKMNPPLRSASDREGLMQGVLDGTLSVLATDHAPHPMKAKERGFVKAPFGVVGLETAVGVTYTLLVKSGKMNLHQWLRAWTTHPAKILNKPPPSLAIGQPASLVFLDLDNQWTVDAHSFKSLSRNTPFNGMNLYGQAKKTIVNGRLIS